MILGKMIFFFVFGRIPENILQCYAKDRAERVGVRRGFWKMVCEKIGRKPFSKF